MEIKKIERADDLIVREYNELVNLYKNLKMEESYLNDEIKCLNLDMERYKELEKDFEKTVEKEVEKKYRNLISQVKSLKRNAEKHIEEKNALKEENKELKKAIDCYPLIKSISDAIYYLFEEKSITINEAFYQIIINIPQKAFEVCTAREILYTDPKRFAINYGVKVTGNNSDDI